MNLDENQHKYIKREAEYREVIDELQNKIKDNSTRPLDIIEEKTEDQYILEGIDIHDKEQAKKIERLKEIHKKNRDIMDGQSQTGKFIKNLHIHHEELLT